MLTIRISPSTVAKLDRRAAEAGQDRSGYVRDLIEQDVNSSASRRERVFASGDLAGCVDTGIRRADNETVRRVIRERLLARHAKNR
jgi:predicted transcriptional regulator